MGSRYLSTVCEVYSFAGGIDGVEFFYLFFYFLSLVSPLCSETWFLIFLASGLKAGILEWMGQNSFLFFLLGLSR